MLRNILILSSLLAAATASTQDAWAQEDIERTLARAETLYFEAKFVESIQLLTPVDETLRKQTGRSREKLSVKFQLALANIGLNNAAAAKSFLLEIYAQDPEFVVDPQQFSPKVLSLANEARTEQSKLTCKLTLEKARKNLDEENVPALLGVLPLKATCADLASLEPATADLLFRKGLADYRLGNLPAAAHQFRIALGLASRHEMATEYLELAENKLQVAKDRALLDWQKSFEAGQFKEAAVAYRQLASFIARDDEEEAPTLNLMQGAYRKALGPLVDAWNVACSDGDFARTDEIKDEIADLLPEPSFGTDIRSRMVPCTPQALVAFASTPPVATLAPAANKVINERGCFHMEPQLALLRLKQRVEPNFSSQVFAFLQNTPVTVMVKVRIEETGNVTVIDAVGSNSLLTNPVRSAVASWKFSPAIDDNGPRCVESEFPIVISKR